MLCIITTSPAHCRRNPPCYSNAAKVSAPSSTTWKRKASSAIHSCSKPLPVLLGDARKFKAGEYDFSAAISPRLIMDSGSPRAASWCINSPSPRGLTSAQVIDILKKEPALEGEIAARFLKVKQLPETYHFTYGDNRQAIIGRMQAGMTSVMGELWEKRDADLPFASPQQALTRSLPPCRRKRNRCIAFRSARAAAVFINRLRKVA